MSITLLTAMDTYNMDFPTNDSLNFLDPSHLGSVFPLVELGQPNLSFLLQEHPEELRTKLFVVVRDSHLEILAKVRS